MSEHDDKITYLEASTMLERSLEVIQQVVHKGILTPYPRNGKYRHISRKQVSLFLGKKYLSLSSLSQSELRIWQGMKEAIEQAHNIKSLSDEIEEKFISHFAELYTQKVTGIEYPTRQGIDTYMFAVNALAVMKEDEFYEVVSTIIKERLGDFISIIALCIIKYGVIWVIQKLSVEKTDIDQAMKLVQTSDLPYNVIDIIETRMAKERNDKPDNLAM